MDAIMTYLSEQNLQFVMNNSAHSEVHALIIEDQRSASYMLKSLLQNLHIYNVDLASTEQEATRYCQLKHYDLVIMDYHLNGENTGSELLANLRTNNLISINTTCVIISGDSSHEVILSSMEAKPDAFICKPVNLTSLSEQLQRACSETAVRYPFMSIAQQQGPQAAIHYGLTQLKTLNTQSRSLHTLLLDMLIAQKDWPQLEHVINLVGEVKDVPLLEVAKAHLDIQQESLQDAERRLKTLLKHQPLFLAAVDLLCQIKIKQHEFSEALIYAEQASKLTPNNTERIMLLARLAVKEKEYDIFNKTGDMLAAHLHFQESNWLVQLTDYVVLCESVYQQKKQLKAQQNNYKEINLFFQKVKLRLPKRHYSSFYALANIALARNELLHNSPHRAKQHIYLALTPHLTELNNLSLVVQIYALTPIMELAESNLSMVIYQSMKNNNTLTVTLKNQLQKLKQSLLFKRHLQLIKALKEAKNALSHQPTEALMHYNKVLEAHPACSEAHLGRLEASLKLQNMDKNLILTSFSAITLVALPLPLKIWCDELAKKYQELGISSPLHKHRQGELFARPAIS